MSLTSNTFAFDYEAGDVPALECVVQYEPGDREVGIVDSWYLVSAITEAQTTYDRDEFEFSFGSDALDVLEQYGAELAQAAMDEAVYRAMTAAPARPDAGEDKETAR